MPDLFSPFSLPIMSVLVLWITAMVLLMGFDLRRMRQSQQRFVWYERPLLWFAVCGISFGLSFASSTLLIRGSLSDLLYWSLIFGPLILFALSLFGGLIAALRPVSQKSILKAEMRLRQQAESNSMLVAKSRPIENQTILMMIVVGIHLGILALMDFISFYLHLTQEQFILGEGLLLLTFLLLLLSRSLVLHRLSKRFNQRRIMLAVEKRRSVNIELISQEPLQSLLLPLVLRLKRSVITGYLVLFLTIFLLFWLSLTNFANSFTTIYYLYLLPLNLLFKLLFGFREQVETTTHGLVVTRGTRLFHQTQQMPWQEARLFTCYQIPGFLGGRTMMTYELASAGRVVQWTRVINTHSLFTPWRTELLAEEYSQQTQALCACITAKTGLELHDLSEERPNTEEQEMMALQTKR